jgi:hypothetical protein
MRASRITFLAVATLALALGVSCGRSKPVGVDADVGNDAGGDANQVLGKSCLDSPDQLTRPPTAGLPCELIPPGLAL